MATVEKDPVCLSARGPVCGVGMVGLIGLILGPAMPLNINLDIEPRSGGTASRGVVGSSPSIYSGSLSLVVLGITVVVAE